MSPSDAAEPRWVVTDPETFMEAVRASEGPVRAVRKHQRRWSDELGREVQVIEIGYAVRAESKVGWGTYVYTEFVDLEEVTGRIAAAPDSMWRWLRRKVGSKVWVDGGTPGATRVSRMV